MAVVTTPPGSEAGEDSVVSDYYDSKGNIMTLRRKRSIWSLGNIFKPDQRKQRSTKKKKTGADPAGRSYYYSTYRYFIEIICFLGLRESKTHPLGMSLL